MEAKSGRENRLGTGGVGERENSVTEGAASLAAGWRASIAAVRAPDALDLSQSPMIAKENALSRSVKGRDELGQKGLRTTRITIRTISSVGTSFMIR